jgi:hypothetical protein
VAWRGGAAQALTKMLMARALQSLGKLAGVTGRGIVELVDAMDKM